MSFLCHFLLFFYSILGMIASLCGILIYGRVLPDEKVSNELLFISTRWETLGILILIFLVSLYLFIKSISSNKKEISVSDTVVIKGEMGDVKVSISALKEMAIKLSKDISGIRDIKVSIKLTPKKDNKKEYIPKFYISLTVSEKEAVATISDSYRNALEYYLKSYIGTEESVIDIVIKKISQDKIHGKKRVV